MVLTAQSTLNGAFFYNVNEGLVSGTRGYLGKTTDGGASWVATNSDTTRSIFALSQRNGDTLTASGSGGLFAESVDRGNSWNFSRVSPPTLNRGHSWISSTVGVMAGHTNRMFLTLDAGKTWFHINANAGPGQDLHHAAGVSTGLMHFAGAAGTYFQAKLDNVNPFTIQVSDTFLIAGQNASTYLWYKDGVLVSGIQHDTLTATENGVYQVLAFSNGCLVYSTKLNFINPFITASKSELKEGTPVITNPVQEHLHIQFQTEANWQLQLFDGLGKQYDVVKGNGKEVNRPMINYPSGVYFIKLEYNNSVLYRRIVKS